LLWKKRPAAVAEKNKGLFTTFSADQLTDASASMTFWRSLRTRGNANDVQLAKIALWRVTLFCSYHG